MHFDKLPRSQDSFYASWYHGQYKKKKKDGSRKSAMETHLITFTGYMIRLSVETGS